MVQPFAANCSRQFGGLSPVRKLEREAMVGSLADDGPADGRSNLQSTRVKYLMRKYLLSRSVQLKEAVTSTVA